MNRILALFAVLALFVTSLLAVPQTSDAQVFFSNTRVGSVAQSHSTVGTSTADAIADADVAPRLLAWSICNDAVNTSTYLYVGQASNASTDGVMLAPGACFECPNCNSATLKAARVLAQAASNGYSVIQYKQQ